MRRKSNILYIVFYIFCVSLSGCVSTSDRVEPTDIVQISDAELQDAEAMAAEMNISVEEAVNRLNLQDAIGNLSATLSEKETETFAGLWIEYEPEYRVVASFTRNGKITIQPYIQGTALQEIVDVETAQRSLEELINLQQEVSDLSTEMGLSISSGINIPENQVEIYLTDESLWESKLRENNQQIPVGVKAVVIYEPLAEDAIPAITPAPGIFLPQLRVKSAESMAALLEGDLEIVASCPRIIPEYDSTGWLIIWQPDYFVSDNHGIIEIIDRDGQAVARQSEHINMGGGEIPSISFEELREPIPSQCEGPYWLMGELVVEK